MPEEKERRTGEVWPVQEFVSQLRGIAERLTGLSGLAENLPTAALPSLPSLPGMPRLPSGPGALSAAQLQAMSSTVAAQRRSIEALRSQLAAFDEQLQVLEQILEPLTEWSRTWAGVEDRLLRPLRGQEGQKGEE